MSSCIMDTLTPLPYLQPSAGVDDSCSQEVSFAESDQDVALSPGGNPSNKARLHQVLLGQLLDPLHPGPLHLHLAAHQDRAAWH